MGLTQYRVNIPVTYFGETKEGIFKKKSAPYSITFTSDPFQTIYTGNARSVSSIYRRAMDIIIRTTEKTFKSAQKQIETNGYVILTGNVETGFVWSKKFYKLERFDLGQPQITKIREWSEATMKELCNSGLTIPEFQEVFNEIKTREKE